MRKSNVSNGNSRQIPNSNVYVTTSQKPKFKMLIDTGPGLSIQTGNLKKIVQIE